MMSKIKQMMKTVFRIYFSSFMYLNKKIHPKIGRFTWQNEKISWLYHIEKLSDELALSFIFISIKGQIFYHRRFVISCAILKGYVYIFFYCIVQFMNEIFDFNGQRLILHDFDGEIRHYQLGRCIDDKFFTS